jgi:hypothetical protein
VRVPGKQISGMSTKPRTSTIDGSANANFERILVDLAKSTADKSCPIPPQLVPPEPFSGSMRLAREGDALNHKKLCRLYREERLMVRRRRGRKRALGTRAPA